MYGEVGEVLVDVETLESIPSDGCPMVMTKSGAAHVHGQRRPRPPVRRPS